MMTRRHRFLRVFAPALLTAVAGAALAQHAPTPHGAMDATTVVTPATGPATALPAGHPSTTAPAGFAHTGNMQTSKTGALRVLLSQGTKDAPAIGKDAVRVELFAKGIAVKTYVTAVDDKGIVELHDLPLDPPFQPVVTVIHHGAEEQFVGPPMHKYQPAIELPMRVFETTDVKPEWTIGLRHVVTETVAADGGTVLRCTEMIGGFNPTDRAWVGEGPTENRRTMSLPLPTGATNVQFGPGLAEAGARVVDGCIVRGKTMLPGSTQYVFAYDIPVTVGRASVSFTAPADTTLFAVYVPNGAKVDQSTGLEAGAASGTHGVDAMQLLKAKAVKAGAVATVELSGLKAPVPATKPAETEPVTDLHLPVPATGPGR